APDCRPSERRESPDLVDLRRRRARPAEPVRRSLADVADENRAEARHARPAGVPPAPIDHPERTGAAPRRGALLRGDLALPREARRELPAPPPQVVEARAEVGAVLDVRRRLLRPRGLDELEPLVVGHLGPGGLALEAGVPRAAIGSVEPAPVRMGM